VTDVPIFCEKCNIIWEVEFFLDLVCPECAQPLSVPSVEKVAAAGAIVTNGKSRGLKKK
jgi:hypothetical protein